MPQQLSKEFIQTKFTITYYTYGGQINTLSLALEIFSQEIYQHRFVYRIRMRNSSLSVINK